MPTYQYRCTECGHDLEAVQKFTDAALTECPSCGGALRKVYNAVGVVFKGSGFYRTDNRKSPSEGGASGSSAPAPAKESAGASSGNSASSAAGSDSNGSSSKPAPTKAASGSGSSTSSTAAKAASS